MIFQKENMSQATLITSLVQIALVTDANIYTVAKDSVSEEVLAMDEYIERKALRDTLYDADAITMSGVKILNQFPSADVAPVRHGRWVSVPHKLARVCSVCNRDEPYKFADVDADVYNYCPHCGAKMDKGKV